MDLKKGKGNAAILKNFIITGLVIAFFLFIILSFYNVLYDAKREIIIKNGETSAKESAEKFDDYLSTSVDAIKLTAYTVEGMTEENRPNEEILDYLVGQTVAIKSAVFENTSGLYGYINGEFLDGLLWEPPDGFVATERPWYIKAKEKNGEVAMVEPYLDLQTDTVLMSISKLLSNGKDAVSMDISLDIIQKITEEAVSSDRSDIQIIIDSTGYVVAHSDKEEVGKHYSSEDGSLGAEVIKLINPENGLEGGYFELNYNGTQYIVYAVDLKNDFLCISIKDATSIFMPLTTIFVLTVAAVAIVVAIVLYILIISNRKQRVMEKIGKQLSATADIYISLHEIDFLTDTFSEVRNNHSGATEMIGDTRNNCQETIRSVMTAFSDPSSREALLDFVDFSKLNMRLKDRDTITLEWLDSDRNWRRSRYIVSERTPTGIIARAMYLIEDIDAEKRERDITLEALKMMNTQISSVANIFFSMYDIDLTDNTFREIKTHTTRIGDLLAKPIPDAQKKAYESMNRIVGDASRDVMHTFVDFSTLDERLRENNNITAEFVNKNDVWLRARFVVSKCDETGRLEHVLWLVESIDEEKRKRDSLTEAAQTLNYRVSSISNIYMTVHEVDIASDTFVEIKADKKYIDDSEGEVHLFAQKTLRRIMESFSDESCIEDMRRFVDFSTLEQRLRRIDTIAIEYMNKQKLWRRARFVASRRDKRGRLTHVLWLAEDIDEEKKERDKLIDMSERAIAASEAKSAFLSNMSHEIRTPINAVLGMNEMILRECEDPNILTYSNSIRTAGSTLLGLVNDILDFSKIEAGKMEIIPVDYDLSSVINDLVNMIQTKADDKGLQLILDISTKIPKRLHGDEVRIKQVITNILNNAVKYTEKGSVTFVIAYEELPDEPDSIMLDVSVQDTGIGIKQEDMNKLFSEFERIDEERNRKVEGTGLGMSITKRLLEMMGTTLEVESIYKLGSKFSFRLKQKVVKWEALGDYEASYKASLETRERYREKFRAPTADVLVIDDTPMNLVVFKSLLKQTEVRVDMASSGDEGLDLSGKKKYDIIFLDHMMPEKDGIETLHDLRARSDDPNLTTPVICLTANAVSGAREVYLAEGFDDYLTKPIDPVCLEELLLEFIPNEKIIISEDAADVHEASDRSVSGASSAVEESLPAFLSETDELDTEKGVMNCGSVEGYIEAMQIYAEMTDDMTDEIERYLKGSDFENAVIKIHAMKSTLRIIGAGELSDIAQEIENAGKDRDAVNIDLRIDELLGRSRKLAALLKGLIDEDKGKPEISIDELIDLYTTIEEYMLTDDPENAVRLIGKLRDYSIPDSEKARCDTLIRAAEEKRYEMITEALEKV